MSKVVDKVTKFLMIFACVILALVVLITIANVVGRKFLNAPIKGATELIQYGVMLAVGLVMACTGFEGRHIWVPILVNKFGQVGSQIFISFGALCGTSVFAVLGYLFLTEIPQYTTTAGRVTEAWHIPYYIIYAIMGIGFVVATLEYFFELCLNISKIGKKQEELPAETDTVTADHGDTQ